MIHHFTSYAAARHTKIGLIAGFRREAEVNGTDRLSQILGNILLPSGQVIPQQAEVALGVPDRLRPECS